MKTTLRPLIALCALVAASQGQAQRYLTEVFTNDQITVTPNLIYGTNIDFLTSNLGSPNVPAELVELQTAVSTGQPIPAAYFNPADGSTALKVTNLRMDVYQPDQTVDNESERPVVVYLHTGNALPPPINGSPNGQRTDSTAVEICRQMARRGYVAVSMSYRLGWNPLAASEQERRGQLLNAIYRAIHDTRQCIRHLKQEANEGGNPHGICTERIIVLGEGTGGYVALANATLDNPAELFIEKFRPDPFNPNVSYVDTNMVGNLAGFGGMMNLYRPNGYDHTSHFCVNLGGALADESWLAPGDVPMVAFHTVFDPFAPFTSGIVIVPTTGGPVVPVHGSNHFMPLVNQYGNNAAFANLPDGDPFTDRARSLYGTTQTHGSVNVTINTGAEGLFPVVRPFAGAPFTEESSPWQFWDPNSPLALTEIQPGVTAHMAAMMSNPDMSPAKARAYIDSIMGYLNPRIHAALQLDAACATLGVDEMSMLAANVELYPNPAHDVVTISSRQAAILRYEVLDLNGRLMHAANVNRDRFEMARNGLAPGVYFVKLHFAEGTVTRKLVMD